MATSMHNLIFTYTIKPDHYSHVEQTTYKFYEHNRLEIITEYNKASIKRAPDMQVYRWYISEGKVCTQSQWANDIPIPADMQQAFLTHLFESQVLQSSD